MKVRRYQCLQTEKEHGGTLEKRSEDKKKEPNVNECALQSKDAYTVKKWL